MERELVTANFYLFGYYIACLQRNEGYIEQYQNTDGDDEDQVTNKAAISYLTSTCANFRRLAELVAGDLGLDVEHLSPDDRDSFLDTINSMEGRNPSHEFVRNVSPRDAYEAFVLGDYIGGEIGFCHEYGKMLVNGTDTSRDGLVTVLQMKVDQFDEYMGCVPERLGTQVNKKTIETRLTQIRNLEEPNEGNVRVLFDALFETYSAVTDYYLSIRTGGDVENDADNALYFISYARRNRVKANQVELLLLRRGRRTWRDETDIRAGTPLLSSLYSGIDEAHTFICLLTQQYIESNWCMEELERAVSNSVATGKPSTA